jgi:hypothetical protein
VHEVKIDVLQTEVGQGLIKTLLDISRAVEGGPQLGGDEDILALESSLLQTVLDTSANSIFVAILYTHRLINYPYWKRSFTFIEKTYGIGSINMTVTSGDSGLDSSVDFFGLGLPSSQTDGRDSGASVAVDGMMSGYVHSKRHIIKDRDLQLEDFVERHNEITSDEN